PCTFAPPRRGRADPRARLPCRCRHPESPRSCALPTHPPRRRLDVRRAVALIDVTERQTSGSRARTVVSDDLHLGVTAVRRPHRPHVRLGAQHVREEAVVIPRCDGGIARLAAAVVGEIAICGHVADVVEARVAQIADPRTDTGDDRVAAKSEIAGRIDDGAEPERKSGPRVWRGGVYGVDEGPDE